MRKPSPAVSRTAVILAGGLGTRLRAAVGDCPKPLAPINGRPFLDYQIAHLARAGFNDIILCVGYGAQDIVDALGAQLHGARLRYVRDWPLRGTGGALRNVLPALASPQVLVVNGDSYSTADLGAFAAAHAAGRPVAKCTMLLSWRDDRDAFGGVTIGDWGSGDREPRRGLLPPSPIPQPLVPIPITAFHEKQQGIGPGYVNAGVYMFERATLAEIKQDRVVSLERDVLPRMIGRGLAGWVDAAAFIDIGTPDSYRRAHTVLREAAA